MYSEKSKKYSLSSSNVHHEMGDLEIYIYIYLYIIYVICIIYLDLFGAAT